MKQRRSGACRRSSGQFCPNPEIYALDLARIRAICFDVDGTLSDTDDEWVLELEDRLKPLLFFPVPKAPTHTGAVVGHER